MCNLFSLFCRVLLELLPHHSIFHLFLATVEFLLTAGITWFELFHIFYQLSGFSESLFLCKPNFTNYQGSVKHLFLCKPNFTNYQGSVKTFSHFGFSSAGLPQLLPLMLFFLVFACLFEIKIKDSQESSNFTLIDFFHFDLTLSSFASSCTLIGPWHTSTLCFTYTIHSFWTLTHWVQRSHLYSSTYSIHSFRREFFSRTHIRSCNLLDVVLLLFL